MLACEKRYESVINCERVLEEGKFIAGGGGERNVIGGESLLVTCVVFQTVIEAEKETQPNMTHTR